MSSKFFNNDTGNTLFDKLKGIASSMANFNRFLAVVGSSVRQATSNFVRS